MCMYMINHKKIYIFKIYDEKQISINFILILQRDSYIMIINMNLQEKHVLGYIKREIHISVFH